MDPAFITNLEWTDIGNTLTLLWFFVLFVVIFAANLLLGHAVIPSMVATGHLPESFLRMRRGFYSAAMISFGAAMFFLAKASDMAHVIGDVWERWWI